MIFQPIPKLQANQNSINKMKTSKNIRVRFAPSPTGALHIGGVRTALYNYLFAKKHNGSFVLRIEDTDQTRFVPNAEKYIIDALNWAGIPFDEGIGKNEKFAPYRQSERKEIYQKHIEILLEKGKAYYAFDSQEELEHLRKDKKNDKVNFMYNWSNRENLNNSIALPKEIVAEKLKNKTPFVIRFKNEPNEDLILNDKIRGEIKVNTSHLEDKILFKSDGLPTYHLANVVDDHLMEISHIIRGEEWLPSMALHILLYQSFGWEIPEFAHLPLILKPSGKGKLSKRDGDKFGFPVFPMNFTDEKTGEISMGYKEEGYSKEAFVNALAFLGWNPGDEKEIYSLEELIQDFSLERVNKSGAKFSIEKVKWFNQQHLQNKNSEELYTDFKPILEDKNISAEKQTVIQVLDLIKERAVFVKDFWELSHFFLKTQNHTLKSL